MTNEAAERLRKYAASAMLVQGGDQAFTKFHDDLDQALADARQAGAAEERERIRLAFVLEFTDRPEWAIGIRRIHAILDAEAQR